MTGGEQVGSVGTLWRYPVKSMLGEAMPALDLDADGVVGDRRYALVDVATGAVASPKRPAKWRRLLALRASTGEEGGGVRIAFPDGSVVPIDEPEAARVLSTHLGREVVVRSSRRAGDAIEHADPERVVNGAPGEGDGAERLVLAGGTGGDRFVDFGAVHLVTTSSLARVAALAGVAELEVARYRPNVLLTTDDDVDAERTWPGRRLRIGEVVLEVVIPTPRCAIPTLAHGPLPPRRDAYRAVAASNRIAIPDFATMPCLGVYASVVQPGRVETGAVAVLE